MLINISNHASAKWSAAQKQTANRLFGEIRDVPFPAIDPQADLNSIIAVAQDYVQKCQALIQRPATNDQRQTTSTQRPRSAFLFFNGSGAEQANAIHVMGEMTFVYQFVKLAAAAGLRCVASTTERISVDNADGSKTSEFRFVRFRDYEKRIDG
jgi:hypothetical protein